jgi:hypothetical protein
VFPSSERQGAVLHSIVRPATDLLLVSFTQVFHRRFVGSKSVRRDLLGGSVALQRLFHENYYSCRVPGLRDGGLQRLALVIDGAPEVMHLAIDLHLNLVEMPPPVTKTPHHADPMPANVAGKHRAATIPPETHRLVANIDAALEEKILDIPQSQRKPDVR